MTENENQEASNKRRLIDNNGVAPWSDLDHDLLLLVMMKLGVVDFPPFSGVCKSWRSHALSNKTKFMASRPPMTISIPDEPTEEDCQCSLEDTEGRTLNSILPHSGNRTCIGFTCGHLILFGKETNDIWLLDPVTKHGVHFPNIPSSVNNDPGRIRGILVFSPSTSGWVFVMRDGSANIWFSKAGQGGWDSVSCTHPVVDVHAFKGKLYVIHNARHLFELTINPEAKLVLLETKDFPHFLHRQWVSLLSYAECLYVRRYMLEGYYELHRLDFEEMKWVLLQRPKKTGASGSRQSNVKQSEPRKGKSFVWKHMEYPLIV